MKTSTFPTYQTTTDWSKLDQIEDDIRRNREALAAMKSKLDKMKQTLDRHRQFETDRQGPMGWIYRWFQVGGGW